MFISSVKKFLALTAAAGVAAALAIPSDAATRARTIKLGNNYFVRKGSPPTVTVKRGQKVVFYWSTSRKHNVFQAGGPIDGKHFHINDQRTGKRVTHIFHTKGTYPLVCTYHNEMKMTLVVK